MRSLYVSIAVLALATLGACRLQRQHEFLQHQYQVRDVDNAISEQQKLEQEYQREMTHVNRLNAEVARLLAREEALALEKRDMDGRVGKSKQEMGALQAQLDVLNKQAADQKNLIVAGQKQMEAGKTPQDREKLEARIAQLRAEAERLAGVLSKLPPPAPPAPPAETKPAPPAETKPAPPAETKPAAEKPKPPAAPAKKGG